MKKYILAGILFLISSSSFAGYTAPSPIKGIYIGKDGMVRFNVEMIAEGTCDFYNYRFAFDGSTPGGKSMLSLLLSAKIANKDVNVWYNPSTTPGTINGEGCTLSTLAQVTNIGLR